MVKLFWDGDQISGERMKSESERSKTWCRALAVCAHEFNIQFATIFGNHDDQPPSFDPVLWNRWSLSLCAISLILVMLMCVMPRKKQGKCVGFLANFILLCASVCYVLTLPRRAVRFSLLEQELIHFPTQSVTKQGPLDVYGLSNYHVLVSVNATQSLAIYFLDSGGGWLGGQIHSEQIEWLMQTNLKGVPSVVFMHMPTESFKDLYERERCTGDGPQEQSTVCSGSAGLIDIMINLGVKAVFVGHDHGNAWCCPYKNRIMLCYGRHTGFGGYDILNLNQSTRGARVITVNTSDIQSVVIDSWIHEVS